MPPSAAAAGDRPRLGVDVTRRSSDLSARRSRRRRSGSGPALGSGPGRAPARGRGQVQVVDQQLLGELAGPGEQLAAGGHDHRVAVEDQLVLAADQVHVGDRGARLGRPALDQRQPYVVLVQLVRRGVDVDDEADAGRAAAANGPPACQMSSQTVSADVHPAEPRPRSACRPARSSGPRRRRRSWAGGAWSSVARPRRRAAAPRRPGGRSRVRRRRWSARAVGVHVADHHGEIAEPVRGQVRGQPVQGLPGRLDERVAEDQILDRIAGQHHLRERHELGAGLGGGAGPAADARRCRRCRRRSSSPGPGRSASVGMALIVPQHRAAVDAGPAHRASRWSA